MFEKLLEGYDIRFYSEDYRFGDVYCEALFTLKNSNTVILWSLRPSEYKKEYQLSEAKEIINKLEKYAISCVEKNGVPVNHDFLVLQATKVLNNMSISELQKFLNYQLESNHENV